MLRVVGKGENRTRQAARPAQAKQRADKLRVTAMQPVKKPQGHAAPDGRQ
jgi:hypothetical protein